jgi:catechol 2,3-dioxygenase-like lactoylglutathione lyase family enzyme
MNLNQVTIGTTDMDASIRFYQTLGLVLIVESPHYARFACPCGEASFSVQQIPGSVASSTTVIYFEVASLDETVRQLKAAGLVFKQDPKDEPWLWREAKILDPMGHEICLYWAGENRLHPPWRIRPKNVNDQFDAKQ